MKRDYSQGSEEAIALTEAHAKKLKLCIWMVTRDARLVEEIYPDVMIAIIATWDKYDPNRPFEDWACGVARNVALANRRKEASRRLMREGLIDNIAQEVEDEEDSILALRIRALSECIKRLPLIHRQLITLRYFEYQSYRQISGVVGRTAAALYVVNNRLNKILRDCITSRISKP